MKVTVCELRNEPDALVQDWQALVTHVQSEKSDMVLLPEMAFSPWLAKKKEADPKTWRAAVKTHDLWIPRLEALSPAWVAGTRPVIHAGKRYNEGFIWEPPTGYHAVHTKYYLPNEENFWEASWYARGDGTFTLCEVNRTRVGFLICTELWFSHHARSYAKAGIHLLVCPRATPAASVEKWVAGGQVAAVVSGGYCLSSNFSDTHAEDGRWGGRGWIIEPEEGEVLGVTSRERPFLTVTVNRSVAKAAKLTYPRYVPD